MTSDENAKPRYASDATSLKEALARFEAQGFTGQMAAREGAKVICFSCRSESPAHDFALLGLIRIEGASDPDDMVAVAALTCPHCGTRGTVALKFGPDATVEDSEVLSELSDQRTDTGTSPGR
jgi:hypothetical protein